MKKELNQSDKIKILAKVFPIGILISLPFLLIIKFLSKINFAIHEIDSYDIVFQCIILLCLSIIPSIIVNVFGISRRTIREQKTDVFEVFSIRILQSLTLISYIFYYFLRSKDGLSMIGLRDEIPGGISNVYLSSVIIFVYFTGIFGLYEKIKNKTIPNKRRCHNSLDDLMILFFPKKRILALIMLLLAVISEEILYRGYIVLFLGTRTDQIIIFGLLSIFITVFGHLYQGTDKIVYHMGLAIVFVLSTLITKSILISITIHLFINIFAILTLWKTKEIEDRTVCVLS